MFSTWDDEVKSYSILNPTGEIKHLTTQELYEYIIFNDIGISEDFSDLKVKLDRGESVIGDYCEWDWNLGSTIYRGRITITKSNKDSAPKHVSKADNLKCGHSNKYINEAGGIKFYVCPQCKADLGNA
jgi:hypothetical protein